MSQLKIPHLKIFRCPLCDPKLHNITYLEIAIDFYSTQKSAKYGCKRCQLVLSVISDYKPQWISRPPPTLALAVSTKNFRMKKRDSQFSSLPSLPSHPDLFKPIYFQAQEVLPVCIPGHESVFGFAFVNTNVPPESRCIDSLAIATQWLKECLDSHQRCVIPDAKFMPSRVIDVGKAVKGIFSDPCLINSKIEPASYVALSYCWGTTSNTLITTRENIAKHCNSIPFLSLPQTLQDAIFVCREMGFRYLWIDAICIIQNEPEEQDWYRECGRMRHIYSNATFVIAADCSAECTDGFLGRQACLHRWQQFKIPVKDNTHITAFVGEAFYHSDPTGLTKSPLSKRGWALQESILPSRILHFTKEEVIWECNTCCRCECAGPTDYHRILRPIVGVIKGHYTRLIKDPPEDLFGNFNNNSFRSIHINNFLSRITPESVSWAWENLVELYTVRQLTNTADKLTAMSGLAQIAMQSLGVSSDSYLAGLWRFGLVEGLLWYVRGPVEPRRYTTYYAPSWSWASIDGSIKYYTPRYQFHFDAQIKILEAECKTLSLDPTGRVTAGRLLVSGTIMPVTLIVQNTDLGSEGALKRNKDLNDREFEAYKTQIVHAQACILSNEPGVELGSYQSLCEVLMDERVQHVHKDISYYCLRIGTVSGRTLMGCVRIWFLVIKRTKEDTFERVGIGNQLSTCEIFDLFDLASAQTQIIELV